RARALAKRLDNAPLAIVDKRRDKPGSSEVMNIIGDVSGRACIMIDDIVDSGGTLCNAAQALIDGGATSVSAYITHGVLSDPAVERLKKSPISRVVLTNTIPLPKEKRIDKIEVLSVAKIIADALAAVFEETSVSELFGGENLA
ncbi:MAG: ribose-phosphate diphosphokinase, partial [Acidimicrobiia bacterium]|nr:ribose-phosphate diphosphokinase [Acidimicrobiia bacterium]